MALPLYLALTAAEFDGCSPLPEKLAWMACHFSPYGTGLSNCPANLPEGAMLILNDRTPIHGHDPELVLGQLTDLITQQKCGCVLLDFQRPGVAETEAMIQHLISSLPCPTAVSDLYAKKLDCAVFLPPVPLDVALWEYIAPWQGREIWLDIAPTALKISLTSEGVTYFPTGPIASAKNCHKDDNLHCHYYIRTEENADFTLWRTSEDIKSLLTKAEEMGVTHAVGLYQELGTI